MKEILLKNTKFNTVKEYQDQIVDILLNNNVEFELIEKVFDCLNSTTLPEEQLKVNLRKVLVIFNLLNSGIIKADHDGGGVDSAHIFNEFLKGGHIVVDDDGKMAETLKVLNELEARSRSNHSHYRSTRDSNIGGASISAEPVFSEILFGVGNYLDSAYGRKVSWIQSEGAGIGTAKDFVAHAAHFVEYKVTGNNIGKYGSSRHNDKNPIIVCDSQHTKLEMVLFKTLVGKSHSHRSGAMHGGFWGVDVAARDALAKRIVKNITQNFEDYKISDDEIRIIRNSLDNKISSFKTRKQVEASFGIGESNAIRKEAKMNAFCNDVIGEVRKVKPQMSFTQRLHASRQVSAAKQK